MLSETMRCFSNAPPLTRQPMEAVIMAQDTLPAIAGSIKCCKACGETKPHSDFYIDKRDGRPMGRCKACWIKKTGEYQRANPEVSRAAQKRCRAKNPEKYRLNRKQWALKNPEKYRLSHQKTNRKTALKKYGITAEELRRAFDDQNGACAICDVPVTLDFGRQTHIDHCHETGKFRGILCVTCNTGLGKFKESPEVLDRASRYLRSKSVQFRGEIIKV